MTDNNTIHCQDSRLQCALRYTSVTCNFWWY